VFGLLVLCDGFQECVHCCAGEGIGELNRPGNAGGCDVSLDTSHSLPEPGRFRPLAAQVAYVFRCAKLYLRAELGNCYAIRGNHQRGVGLLEQVLEESADATLTVAPRGMVAKVACDAISDAKLGNLGFDLGARMAKCAIAELTTLEQFTDQPRRGDVIYPLAVQAAQSINGFGTSEARELAEQLAAIANRPQLSKVPDSAVINTIEKALKSGQFTQALALIKSARSGASALHHDIIFDNFEVIADLHLGRFAPAADGIDRILTAAGGETYLSKLCRSSPSRLGMP
jgi:hypothetical protein